MGAAFTKVARVMAGVIAVSMAAISHLRTLMCRSKSALCCCALRCDGSVTCHGTVSNADGAVL